MPYPTPPQITYSYTGFQQAQGNNSFPGTQLDNDLLTLKQAAAEVSAFVQIFANSDGSLKATAVIGSEALTEAIEQANSSAQGAGEAAQMAGVSANAAAQSASAAAATLSGALVKSQNLADLPDAEEAQINLGLIDGFADFRKVAVGAVIQRAYASASAVATTTTTIPSDDTVPQITEGGEFLTCEITPKLETSILRVTTELNLSPSASATIISALFRDAAAGALAVGFSAGSGAGEMRRVTLTHEVVAGSTAATTFRARAGMSAAGTLTLNGAAGSRLFGGAAVSSISITEFKA